MYAPIRRVVRVEPAQQVTKVGMDGKPFLTLSKPVIHLDCGHRYEGNPIFTYPLGDPVGCGTCQRQRLEDEA